MYPLALNLHETSGAVFSPCGSYRYRLWHRWSPGPVLTCVMLHPAAAGHEETDPAVSQCRRHAENMGFGGLMLVNLFAWRAQNPEALYRVTDPVGADNDWTILEAAQHAGLVLCGWGPHGAWQGRGRRVLSLLRENGIVPHALHFTEEQEPSNLLESDATSLPRPICQHAATSLDTHRMQQNPATTGPGSGV